MAVYALSFVLRMISALILFVVRLTSIAIPLVIIGMAAWNYQKQLIAITDWKWISTLAALGLIPVFFSNITRKAYDALKDTLKEFNEINYIPCLEFPKAWELTKKYFKNIPRALWDGTKKGWALSTFLLLCLILILSAFFAQSKTSSGNPYHVVVAGISDLKRSEMNHLMKGGTIFSLVYLKNAKSSGEGICLTEDQKEWLEIFRKAIEECVKQNKPQEIPVLKIKGFASSAPATPHDEEVNCEFSNQRARVVAYFLTNKGKAEQICNKQGEEFRKAKSLCQPEDSSTTYEGEGFLLEIEQWKNHGDMADERPANDGSPSDGITSAAEFFNRSVHIEIPKDFCLARKGVEANGAEENGAGKNGAEE